MDAAKVRDIVRNELIILKKQIDIEIASDLKKLRNEMVDLINDTPVVQSNEVVNNQLVSLKQETDNQLAQIKESTKELLVAYGTQITKQTYEKVLGEINTKIVPRIDNLIEYVNYQNQDGQEIITNYRRAVDDRVNGQKMLTDGLDDNRVISENVSMFFGEDEY